MLVSVTRKNVLRKQNRLHVCAHPLSSQADAADAQMRQHSQQGDDSARDWAEEPEPSQWEMCLNCMEMDS